ncbi:hypothetical protein ACWT_3217 [Actinoplanes sp. SE50]|uniref:hypothetical protein n=1 Tax=unclassified Actinoplanes TaxID=2626549 RepID=UPI00023EC960|nr:MULTISPECIES: hypothetical protein [unclassified Actinoplanes]AEV84240.1 hypothetical protein ACPL_3345 [Actinoplanes sp. SE50/110]ATO82632.1 hypothetical protein ACWT_3217 [Actinoplanes sp. SE50]SLM00039.1 hypothetical protein ACSP50_3271 [Actinoplanes sp. SE50/110]
MRFSWDGESADERSAIEQRLADRWVGDLDRLIERRLSDDTVDRRLARITGRRRWDWRRFLTMVIAWCTRSTAVPHRPHRPARSRGGSPLARKPGRIAPPRGGHPPKRRLRVVDRSGSGAVAALPAVPLEQVAFDLRRLDRMRRSDHIRRSDAVLAAVLRAYDARLELACRCLGIEEHLQTLQGVDRELERLRLEGALDDVGVPIRAMNP